MITIIRDRETGKAREVLQIAQENNAIVVTPDARAFRVKAHGYGIDDVQIASYEDLEWHLIDIQRPVIFHNLDKVLPYIARDYYGLKTDVIGFSATVGKESKDERPEEN